MQKNCRILSGSSFHVKKNSSCSVDTRLKGGLKLESGRHFRLLQSSRQQIMLTWIKVATTEVVSRFWIYFLNEFHYELDGGCKGKKRMEVYLNNEKDELPSTAMEKARHR